MFSKKFELKLYVPATWEVSGDMPDKWADGLKNNAGRINGRRKAKIPDDGTYILKVATPANEGYVPYVAGGFISRKGRPLAGIIATHQENINRSFNKWNDNLNRAFAEKDGIVAKTFKEKVDAAKANWARQVADKTLRFTGDRIRGRSVGPIAAFYLVGDRRVNGWLRETDYADGAPYNITNQRERHAVKASIQQRILQGGQLIVNQGYQPAALEAENQVNASLLSKLREPARSDAFVDAPASDKCFCSWRIDPSGLLYLHIQVGVTTP
ncbi:MAG: hypothetical protein AB1599_10810 [Planctomycetota bacterium]